MEPERIQLPRIVTGSSDKTLRVWSVKIQNGQLVTNLLTELKDHHNDWVRDVAWSPAIGNSYDLIASCSEVIEIKYFYQKILLSMIYD